MQNVGGQHETTQLIAAITRVVATHTGLTLPAKPSVLAACLLLDESVFSASESTIARACAAHVLAHVQPHLADGGPDYPDYSAELVAQVDAEALTVALCAWP